MSGSMENAIKLHLVDRKGKPIGEIMLDGDATVEDFKAKFYSEFHYYPERQRWTYGEKKTVLQDGILRDQVTDTQKTLVFKDLGVQISWRLVFVMEYLGPLLIYPFFLYFPKLVYGQERSGPLALEQVLSFWVFMGHFAKRELETLFVHRFSNATMPIGNLYKNCVHYWVLAAGMIGYPLFHPLYTAPFTSTNPDSRIPYVLTAIICIFEFLNLQTHIVLRNLRPRGTKDYGIPQGWGFGLVSCANYYWESLTWMAYIPLSGCASGIIFLVWAVQTMSEWALKKHKRLQAHFPDYPKSRRAIFPYIL